MTTPTSAQLLLFDSKILQIVHIVTSSKTYKLNQDKRVPIAELQLLTEQTNTICRDQSTVLIIDHQQRRCTQLKVSIIILNMYTTNPNTKYDLVTYTITSNC